MTAPGPFQQAYHAQRLRREVTPLPKELEPAYQQWLAENGVDDADSPDAYYDYRGAFMAGLQRGDGGHFPDTYKQHGHPTFSVESQYSAGPEDGGRWIGEFFVPPTRLKRPGDTGPQK